VAGTRRANCSLSNGPPSPFHTVLPFPGSSALAALFPSRPEELLSLSRLQPRRVGTVPSRRRLLSSWTYGLAYRSWRANDVGLSPVSAVNHSCPGDPTSHRDGPDAVPESRHPGELNPLLGLQQARELGPPSRPKRDASRTLFAWPLQRRSSPSDPGCVPPRTRGVRAKSSVRARPRTGRIRLHSRFLSHKIAPFETQLTTPAVHTQPEAPASEFLAYKRVLDARV
jgi:hypothetical protein